MIEINLCIPHGCMSRGPLPFFHFLYADNSCGGVFTCAALFRIFGNFLGLVVNSRLFQWIHLVIRFPSDILVFRYVLWFWLTSSLSTGRVSDNTEFLSPRSPRSPLVIVTVVCTVSWLTRFRRRGKSFVQCAATIQGSSIHTFVARSAGRRKGVIALRIRPATRVHRGPKIRGGLGELHSIVLQ
jgi:hypothetical protein